MKKKMRKLSTSELSTLKQHFSPITFSFSQDLVYEKQVPNTGFVLLKGQMELIKRKKTLEKVEPGSLFGVHEMFHGEPAATGCKVAPKSEVIILTKSEIIEAMKNEYSDLRKIIVPE